MFPKKTIKTFTIGDEIKATILQSGNLQEIRKDIIRLNTYVGNNLEPTISNIFLRVEKDGKYQFTRLIGVGSPSKFTVKEHQVIYEGSFVGIAYTVFFSIFENVFFYTIKIKKNLQNVRISIFYGMDVSINNIYAVNNNEAYGSQYIDHKAYQNEYGYVICSRQNQGDSFYLEQGSLTKTIAFATDCFQFYGLNYKLTGIPDALEQEVLPSQIYQYEMAYCALQSESMDLSEDRKAIFYCSFKNNHPEAITKPLYIEEIKRQYQSIIFNEIDEMNKLDLAISFDHILHANPLTQKELDELYPKRELEEIQDNVLLSFFTDQKEHVVTPQKEILMERPSGNIIFSKNKLEDNSYDFESILSDTCYMYGVFSSQITFGNSTFSKLLSIQRTPLNIQKINGQRIFLKINGEYQLLALPSLFAMGLNYCIWYYKLENDLIKITTTIGTTESKIMMSFTSFKHIAYDIIISNHLTMGELENSDPVHVCQNSNRQIRLDFDEKSMAYKMYPQNHFILELDCEYKLDDDAIFYQDEISRNANILTLSLNSKDFRFLIYGASDDTTFTFFDEKEEQNKYLMNAATLINNFQLQLHDNKLIDSFNYLVYWYAQNALVHYITPHGLEQYNGAAWGTRDVCQGPAEFFLAIGAFEEVKRILRKVFEHQFIENGDFPQWFMFDKFSYIQDSSSHGDIIVWPTRLLSLYLEATHDFTFLDEEIPYTNRFVATITKEKYPIIHHLKHALECIEHNFIKDTSLSSYGGGDWDDTLQPAHDADKQKMVSGWTVSLTYEMYKRIAKIIQIYDPELANHCYRISANIKSDYHRLIMIDGIPAGFIHFENEHIRSIIHPSDNVTKMKYRLLPLTRGIISEMFNKEQAQTSYRIIKENLLFPDGVHLMDRTVTYNGGIKTFFNRAETAANFGREIGLQYCHAHIRFLEAMQVIGAKEELYQGLLKVSPVVVTDVVKNSMVRQRNSYYSSSDGNFLNRYDAMNNFDLLRKGEIKVKGGWRIYSSGPGIYLGTLITGLLGIKIKNDIVYFDPVLPDELNGLKFTYKINQKKVKITYLLNQQERKILINNKPVTAIELFNYYRTGGLGIEEKDIRDNDEIVVLQ